MTTDAADQARTNAQLVVQADIKMLNQESPFPRNDVLKAVVAEAITSRSHNQKTIAISPRHIRGHKHKYNPKAGKNEYHWRVENFVE